MEKEKTYLPNWEKIYFAMTTYTDGTRVSHKEQLEALYLCNREAYYTVIRNKFMEDITESDLKIFKEQETTENKSADSYEIGEKQTEIKGNVKALTPKAVLVILEDGKETWIPKSTIHTEYKEDKSITQKFLVDNWLLKRNKVIA